MVALAPLPQDEPGVWDCPQQLMLRCHEVLVIEQPKEGGGEEAGSDPPGEEGEESSEEQGAEHSPQASQSHRQLSH